MLAHWRSQVLRVDRFNALPLALHPVLLVGRKKGCLSAHQILVALSRIPALQSIMVVQVLCRVPELMGSSVLTGALLASYA